MCSTISASRLRGGSAIPVDETLEIAHAAPDAVVAGEDLIEFVADRPGHDQRDALDSSNVRSLGWEPEWTFEGGLERAVQYYLD